MPFFYLAMEEAEREGTLDAPAEKLLSLQHSIKNNLFRESKKEKAILIRCRRRIEIR